MSFEDKWQSTALKIESALKRLIPEFAHGNVMGIKKLREAMEYSSYDGGKRFRPVLCLWTMEALGANPEDAIPFACAVEMIHCYSLIHDDLPCMDNDDFRRGKPTNHKVYGEAMALLAGNALLTEAIGCVSKAYGQRPELANRLVQQLTQAAGAHGMVGGQAIDILKTENEITLAELDFLHTLKTGAMIRVAVTGACEIAGVSKDMAEALKKYAQDVGLAFQIADDLLDYEPGNVEPASYPAVVGVQETKKYLEDITGRAINALSVVGPRAQWLKEVAVYNQNRLK